MSTTVHFPLSRKDYIQGIKSHNGQPVPIHGAIKYEVFKIIQSLNEPRKGSLESFPSITISQLIDKIKTPSASVIEAREHGKKINRIEYDRIKQTSIEAYYPNEYEGISTGYIYLDIDDFNSKDDAIEYRNKIVNQYPDLITLCWLSVSELGLSILIKANDIDKNNYGNYWNALNELFEFKLDKGSKGYSKVNCISYDETIYVNLNSIRFEDYTGGCSAPLFNANLIPHHCTPPNREDSKNTIPLHPPIISLKYKTELPDSSFENINTPVILKEGKEVLEINPRYFTRNRIQIGNRNKVLSALSMQLIVLNPLPEGYSERTLKRQLLNALLSMNKHYTVSPLTSDEVIRMFNSNYKRYKEQGYLDVSKYFKTKFIFWHKECQLPKQDQISIGLKGLYHLRGKGKEYNQQLINDTIESLQDGINPITKQSIMNVTGLSVDAVKRYWKPFKTIIDEYNESLIVKTEETSTMNITKMSTVVSDLELNEYFKMFDNKNLYNVLPLKIYKENIFAL